MPTKIKAEAEPDDPLQVETEGSRNAKATEDVVDPKPSYPSKYDPVNSAGDTPTVKRKPSSPGNDDGPQNDSEIEGAQKRQKTEPAIVEEQPCAWPAISRKSVPSTRQSSPATSRTSSRRSSRAPSVALTAGNGDKGATTSFLPPSAAQATSKSQSRASSGPSSRPSSRQTSPQGLAASSSHVFQTPLTTPLNPIPSLAYSNPSVPLPSPSHFLPAPIYGQEFVSPLTYLPPPPPTPPAYPIPQPQSAPNIPQPRPKGGPYPSRVIEQQAERMMEVIRDEVMAAWQTMKAQEMKAAASSDIQSERVSEGVQTDAEDRSKEMAGERTKLASLLITVNRERQKSSKELQSLKDENARLKAIVDKLEGTIIKLEAKLESSARPPVERQESDTKIKKLEEVNERLRGVITHLDPEGTVTVTEEGFGIYSTA